MTQNTATTTAICYWLDTMGEAWIVSLDEIELPGGTADCTHTLDVCDSEDEAREVACAEGLTRELPVYRNCQGAARLVQDTPDGISYK